MKKEPTNPSIFDEVIDRRNTNSIKYDFLSDYHKPPDVMPMWIADMDFKAPVQVTDALHHIAKHGVFGYSETKENYDNALRNWYRHNFHWNASPDWNVKTPGVVFAIAAAIRAFTKEGDSILIQQPVYYPFMNIVKANDRNLVINELQLSNRRYEIDFNKFERCIDKNKVKLFVLCSPHNPVGRVWTKKELSLMGEICLKYGVYVVSDEIHSDFVYTGNKHTVFAAMQPAFADITVTCTSPTKTFNLAGLQVANIFIANSDMRAAFIRECEKTGHSMPNMAGLAATEAAYVYGQKWKDDLVE
ncbi:MAG: MalY/PatB family protein, partial [Lacrimispora sphenoides]